MTRLRTALLVMMLFLSGILTGIYLTPTTPHKHTRCGVGGTVRQYRWNKQNYYIVYDFPPCP